MRKPILLALLLALAAGAAVAKAPARILPGKKSLEIAFLTDIHVTPGNVYDSALRVAVGEINALPYDLVVVTGDLCNMGSDEELRNVQSILSGIDRPTYVIPGNHETTWSESACTSFEPIFGNPGRLAFRAGDYLFVGFSAGPYMKMAEGTVRPEDLRWIDQTMSGAAPGERIVSMCHFPLNKDVTNREQVTALLRKHEVAFSLCGHYHQLRLMNFDSIPGIMGRALQMGSGRNRTWGYTVLRLEGDSVHVADKVLGRSAEPRFALPLGYSEQIGALEVDPASPPLDYAASGAQLMREDTASIYTGVAVEGSTIYYGNSAGWLHAWDAATDRVRWSHRFPHPLYATPVAADGIVVVGTAEGELCGFDAASGRRKWRLRFDSPIIGDGVAVEGAYYAGLGNGRFGKVDMRRGKLLWEFRFGDGQAQGQPVVAGDKVIFGAWDTHLYCLDARTGELLWKWNNGNSARLFSPGNVVPRVAGGKVFIAAPDRYMTAIDLQSGRQVWRSNEYRVRESTGLSDDERLVYGKTMDGELVAMATEEDRYRVVWKSDAGWGYDHNPCPVTERDGVVYMANRLGGLAAFTTQGHHLWTVKLGNSSANKIFLSPAGDLWVTLIEGKIYRIGK